MKFDLEEMQKEADARVEKEQAKKQRRYTMNKRKNNHAGKNTFRELEGLFDEQTRENT